MGAATDSTVLALFGYQILDFTLVTLDFSAALIFALFSKEPCQKKLKIYQKKSLFIKKGFAEALD
jgi:hypothetical protein